MGGIAKCKKGFKKLKGKCVRNKPKNVFKGFKRSNGNWFIRNLDFLLLIPLTYGLIATAINGYLFQSFGEPLPSIWFVNTPKLIFTIMVIMSIVGAGLMIWNIFKKNKLRIFRIIYALINIGWGGYWGFLLLRSGGLAI